LGKLSFEQLTDLYLLLSVDRIGPAKIRNLLARFKKLSNILSAATPELIETEGISKELASRIRKISSQKDSIQKFLEKELKALDKIGARIITVWDESLMKKINTPLPLLEQDSQLTTVKSRLRKS
jgi:predicted Rossmann fold nucleotide-binding protein DprA/Smf involved in DNA uptake